MKRCRTGLQAQRGYSLAEMIVVVAIIGLFSLFAVPQFMKINQGMRMRASFRQFAADVRGARQRAISKNRRSALTLTTGISARGAYEIWERQDNGTWAQVVSKRLSPESNDVVYFSACTFENLVDGAANVGGDTRPDIVFLPNGTVVNMPTVDAVVTLKTDYAIAKHTYSLRFYGSGNFVSSTN